MFYYFFHPGDRENEKPEGKGRQTRRRQSGDRVAAKDEEGMNLLSGFLSLSLSLCLTVGSWRFRVGIELAPRYYTPCFTRANNFCEKFYQRVEGFFVCELAARLKIMSCLLFWKCDGCLILSVMRMVYIPRHCSLL